MKNKRLIIILSIVPILLAVPLIAMQFTNEVDWGVFDFIIAGMLLSGTGITIEVTLRTVKTTRNRILVCLAVLLFFFLIWAELAVGIFNSPIAGS